MLAAHRRTAGRIQRGWRPYLRIDAKGKRKAPGHDAENRVRLFLDGQGLAYDVRIGIVELAPRLLAQQHYAIAPRLVLFVAECASQNWLHAQHREEVRGDFDMLHLHAASGAYDAGHGAVQQRANPHLCAHGVAQLEHVGVAHHVVGIGAGPGDGHNAIRLRIGQRTQQNAVQHCEDCNVRAQPQRQHGHCRERESGRLAQLSHCVTQILKNRPHRESPFFATHRRRIANG